MSRQGDADIGVFGFSGTVHYAAHDSDLHLFHARIAARARQAFALAGSSESVGHVLEERAGGAAAARTRSHLRRESPQFERLQNLLTNNHLFSAIAVRQRSKRSSNRIADSFLQQHRKTGAWMRQFPSNPCRLPSARDAAHNRTGRQHPIDSDQILNTADLRAQDDLVCPQAITLRRCRRLRERSPRSPLNVTSLASSGSGNRLFSSIMRVSSAPIERSPVHADSHRPVIFDRSLDHRPEVVVVLLADIHVAGIDAILGEGSRTSGYFLQQQMAVVVKIADDRHVHAELVECLDDLRHRSAASSVLTVTRTSSEPA